MSFAPSGLRFKKHAFLIAFALIWNYVPTSKPKDWERITVGMTRFEVYSILGRKIRRLNPGEEPFGWMGSQKESLCEGYATLSKYRSKNIWNMTIEFDGGSEKIAKTIEEYNSNLDDKVVQIRFWQDQDFFSYGSPFRASFSGTIAEVFESTPKERWVSTLSRQLPRPKFDQKLCHPFITLHFENLFFNLQGQSAVQTEIKS